LETSTGVGSISINNLLVGFIIALFIICVALVCIIFGRNQYISNQENQLKHLNQNSIDLDKDFKILNEGNEKIKEKEKIKIDEIIE
jgi:hypothetical protein